MPRRRRHGHGAPPKEPGWKWLYARGSDLSVPAGYAFRERVDPASSELSGTSVAKACTERRAYPRDRMVKITRWEFVTPGGVTFHDEVYHRGRLLPGGVRGTPRRPGSSVPSRSVCSSSGSPLGASWD